MYLVDSCGYTTRIVILLICNFASANLSWLEFFKKLTLFVSSVGMALMLKNITDDFIKYYTHKNIENQEQSVITSGEHQSESEKADEDESTSVQVPEHNSEGQT
jgi:hypothetical protein